MSPPDLRRLLDYSDDDVPPPDLERVRRRAGRLRRRRQAAVAVAAVAAVAASVVVAGGGLVGGPMTIGPSAQDGAGSPVAPQPSIVVPSATLPRAPTSTRSVQPALPPVPPPTDRRIAPGRHLRMGHSWQVWLRNDSVCRSVKQGGGRFQPFGCRSLVDGNIGGIGAQVSGGRRGAMVSAVIPGDVSKVVVSAGGVRYQANLVRFTGLTGWTFYYRWVPGNGAGTPTRVGVVAYDARGQVTGRLRPF